MKLIGLVGPAGSGKTTLANQLVVRRDFLRIRFADPIKAMLQCLLDYQGCPSEIVDRMIDGDLKEIKTEWLAGAAPRLAMQRLGTEWGRSLHPDFWTMIWETSLGQYNGKRDIVVDDIRFKNEANIVREHGGNIVLIQRAGYEPSDHISEQEYLQIKPDLKIINDAEPKRMLKHLEFWL